MQPRPTDLHGYRKQIAHRAGRFGTKELEIVLSQYLDKYGNAMSYNDLEDFEAEVLSLENPLMQRYLMNGEPLQEEHNTKHMRAVLDYVNKRKSGQEPA